MRTRQRLVRSSRSVGPLVLAAAFGLLAACGGSDSLPPPDTAQGAATVWLDAALSSRTSAVEEASTSAFDANAPEAARQVRERFDGLTVGAFRWEPVGGPDADSAGDSDNAGTPFTWDARAGENGAYVAAAVGPGGRIEFEVVKSPSGSRFLVQDVRPSW